MPTHRSKFFNITGAGICLALAIVLPFLTGQIQQIGQLISPMHIPVLLAGFICGPFWGGIVGFAAPLLRGAIFSMPPLMPTGLAMSFELATYAAVAGFLYASLPRRTVNIYVSLIVAMVFGRIVWGLASKVIIGAQGGVFTTAAFMSGAVTGALPAIVIHIILIPLIVMALERAGLTQKAA